MDDDNKKSPTQAYKLFDEGKKLLEVAIELGLSEKEATRYYTEYWKLKGLNDLHSIYKELKGDISLILKLYRLLKREVVLFNKNKRLRNLRMTKTYVMKLIFIAPIILLLAAVSTTATFSQTQNSNTTYQNCLYRYGQNVDNQHGQAITICGKEAYPWLYTTKTNTAWQDFGNFRTILGFKANFPTGFAYNGSGVFIPWSKVCGQSQACLVQPCSALIDSNGVLTEAGNHAVHCIRNGVILGVVAIKLGLPVNVAKSIIGGLAGMTGCSGIVDMNKIKLSNETQFLVRNIGQ